MRDVRVAGDKIAITGEFRINWLDIAPNQIFYSDKVEVEQVSRKLVSIAEGIHAHGLGSTDIYNPDTLKIAQNAATGSFKSEIKALVSHILKSKSRSIS
jgi:hypothetical protein